MPECRTPELFPVWCFAGPDSFSKINTRLLGLFLIILYAVDRPTIPLPIIQISKLSNLYSYLEVLFKADVHDRSR